MLKGRVIPALLLDGQAAVKTRRFSDPAYLGDIVNTASIFNSKMVDELVVFDIGAWRRGSINFDLVRQLGEECFMPLCYGGGLRSVDDAARLLRGGAEKVAVNSVFHETGGFVSEAAEAFGSSSVVVVIDVRRGPDGGYAVYTRSGTNQLAASAFDQARRAVDAGAGELIIQSIDRDGEREGYDADLVCTIADAVPIPVVALGGAGNASDMVALAGRCAIEGFAAGSLFTQYGKHRATLVTYLEEGERRAVSKAIADQERHRA
jgi:imidazole glycerol-phosphate synthase subunit HisF